MALAGPDGAKAAELLRGAVRQGAATLGTITRAAVERLLAKRGSPAKATRLFDDDERKQLADALAATNATAELLGRARIRRRLDQARRHHEARRFAEHQSFSDVATDFSSFADGIEPLPPLRALDYFRSLIPLLGVKEPGRWADDHHRVAWTLAEATEETLLKKVQDLIAEALGEGRSVRDTTGEVDDLLDLAGVTPRNPAYAETVVRTNLMDALNQGAQEELRHPDVIEHLPVWRWDGINDNRARPSHRKRFGHYYPSSVTLAEVRDADGFDGYNERCTPTPIYVDDWRELQAAGASVSRFSEGPLRNAARLYGELERFCQQGRNKGKPGPCPKEKPQSAKTAPAAPPAIPGISPRIRASIERRKAATAARNKAGSVETPIPAASEILPKVTDVRKPLAAVPDAVRAQGERMAASLDSSQRDALANYTKEKDAGQNPLSYVRLNKSARNCPDTLDCLSAEQRKSFDVLNKIASQKLPQPVVAYRGVKLRGESQEKFLAMIQQSQASGQPVQFSGISSTSLDPEVGGSYAGGEIVLEMATTTGAYVEGITNIPGEKELMQPHGIKYRVVGVQKRRQYENVGSVQYAIQLEEVRG